MANRHLNVWFAGNTGQVILLIHGVRTNHMLWCDIVPLLSRCAKGIVPDMLGYGQSDRPAAMPVDVVSQASYLAELMEVLGVETATVVGRMRPSAWQSVALAKRAKDISVLYRRQPHP